MKNEILKRFFFVVGIALLAGSIAAPPQYYAKVLGDDNMFVQKMEQLKVTLGLDLAGGTELDYRIDLSDAIAQNSDDDPLNDVNLDFIAESVRDALESRVNPAGVGEVIVKRSQVEGEEHVLVQLPPSSNVDKAKRDAEKDNRLEFFEEDPALEAKVKAEIEEELMKVNPKNWEQRVAILTERENISHEVFDFRYRDGVTDSALAAKLFPLNEGDILPEVVETRTEMSYTMDDEGGVTIESYPEQVLSLVKVTGKREQEREKPIAEKAHAQHILFGYPGAMRSLDLGEFTTVDEALAGLQMILDDPDAIPEEERDEKIKATEDKIQIIKDFPYKTKEEAKLKAEAMLSKLQLEGTENFTDLAKENSTEGSAKERGGDLGFFEPGNMVGPFNDAVFNFAKQEEDYAEDEQPSDVLTEETEEDLLEEEETTFVPQLGLIQEVIETDFGYHIIEVLDYKTATSETKLEPQISYELIAWNKGDLRWEPTDLGGTHLENATVGYDQVGQPLVNLLFNADGGDLFAKLTGNVAARNGQCDEGLCRLGIKVGGKWITTPTVREKIFGRQSQITGSFTYEGAHQLASDLNLGAIDAPVVLSGQTTIKPELGADQLNKSLKAAAYGFIATLIFMIVMYRMAGVVAGVALILYTALFVTLLKLPNIPSDLYEYFVKGWWGAAAALSISGITSLYFKDRFSKVILWLAFFILGASTIILILGKLGGTIVLTLSGMAGVALSMGLAVDGNILIFERMREEYASKKNLSRAADLGFERAWTAIRDSNLTTLLTCVILFSMGSSIVKGFAITLIVGTLLSMFTAITISRNLLRFILLFDICQKPWLFAISKGFVEKKKKESGAKIRKR